MIIKMSMPVLTFSLCREMYMVLNLKLAFSFFSILFFRMSHGLWSKKSGDAQIRGRGRENMTTTSQGQIYMLIAVEEIALRSMSEGYEWNKSTED